MQVELHGQRIGQTHILFLLASPTATWSAPQRQQPPLSTHQPTAQLHAGTRMLHKVCRRHAPHTHATALPSSSQPPTCCTKSVASCSMGSSSPMASRMPVPAHAMPTAMAAPYLRGGWEEVGRVGGWGDGCVCVHGVVYVCAWSRGLGA